MARTTIDIDTPLLEDLKRIQAREGKSLGRIVSDLLSDAIARHRTPLRRPARLKWASRDMGAKVDLDDREAVAAALDEGRP